MNDDPFDKILERRIEQALAVDPSPAFLVRVRQHIAAHTPSAPSLAWKRCIVLATSVAAVAVALFLVRPFGPEPVPFEATSPKIENVIPRPTAPPTTVVVTRRSERSTVAKRQPSEPVVLIPSAEVEGFRRLVQGVNDGRIDLLQLAQLQRAAEELATPREIVVTPIAAFEPLRIEPLDRSAQDERGNP
jgi:hypothetical protein